MLQTITHNGQHWFAHRWYSCDHDGIRLNNLIPGRIDTERVGQLDAVATQRQGMSVEAVRAKSIAKIPMKRLGTTDEFGAAAAFLLSPAAAYITGATLRVDGGQMRSIAG
jgi:3-oxoacyl-[acyl-carrier protein] reductase